MKIGFLGNTNNYAFQLAEVIRAKGHEVVFIVNARPSFRLDRPEYMQMTSVTYPYPSWIIENINKTAWPTKLFPWIFARDRIKILNTCDAVILNGIGHVYKPYLDPSIPSVSMFSGTDLGINARLDEMLKVGKKFPFNKVPFFLRKLILAKYVRNVRRGISQASVISYFPVGFHPAADALIDEIMKGVSYKRFEHFHIRLDNIAYAPPVPKEKLCVFNVARFLWKDPLPDGCLDWENKRNDIMIRGLANFIKNSNIELDINFVEKGPQVAESKKLADEVGLSPYITWHQEMSLKEMQDFYIKSDILFDHLGHHIFGGSLYGNVLGRPVITNTRREIFERIMGVPMEIPLASNEKEVEEWLNLMVKDKQFRISKGKALRDFVIKHFDIAIEADFFLAALQEVLDAK